MIHRTTYLFSLRLLFILVFICHAFVVTTAVAETSKGIQAEAEQIKKDILSLGQELSTLQQGLLYPADTQIMLYLSTETPSPFILDSIEIKLDGAVLTTYLYTESEVNALAKGGVQRLYIGHISEGSHTLEATFNGQGVDDHYFRRNKVFEFTKKSNSKHIQMIISTTSRSFEPKMTIKDL